MVRAKLSLYGLAVVPDRPHFGAAVVVLVADPAAAAFVVLVADDQARVVLRLVVIASHDLAAGRLFGHEVDLCANHGSLPSRWQESYGRPVGDWPVALITMRVCRRLPAPRSCPDAHPSPTPILLPEPDLRTELCTRCNRTPLWRSAAPRPAKAPVTAGWPANAVRARPWSRRERPT